MVGTISTEMTEHMLHWEEQKPKDFDACLELTAVLADTTSTSSANSIDSSSASSYSSNKENYQTSISPTKMLQDHGFEFKADGPYEKCIEKLHDYHNMVSDASFMEASKILQPLFHEKTVNIIQDNKSMNPNSKSLNNDNELAQHFGSLKINNANTSNSILSLNTSLNPSPEYEHNKKFIGNSLGLSIVPDQTVLFDSDRLSSDPSPSSSISDSPRRFNLQRAGIDQPTSEPRGFIDVKMRKKINTNTPNFNYMRTDNIHQKQHHPVFDNGSMMNQNITHNQEFVAHPSFMDPRMNNSMYGYADPYMTRQLNTNVPMHANWGPTSPIGYPRGMQQNYANIPMVNSHQNAHGFNNQKNGEEPINLYKALASQGYVEAQYNLGHCYEHGINVDKNPIYALQLYKKAADQGHNKSQHILGTCYEKGIYILRNEEMAVNYYKLASDQGYAPAQCSLGYCYYKGIGIETEIKEAIRLYTLAAEKHYAAAQYNLGVLYEKAIGVAKDPKRAVRLYKLAADQRHVHAIYNLGHCYEIGLGVEQNNKMAVQMYFQAASQDLAEAQWRLGYCYENGIGVPKNEREAFRYYKMAAGQGNARALCSLAFCYQYGIGVVREEKEALKLYRMAADQGYEKAKGYLIRYSYEKKEKADELYELAHLTMTGDSVTPVSPHRKMQPSSSKAALRNDCCLPFEEYSGHNERRHTFPKIPSGNFEASLPNLNRVKSTSGLSRCQLNSSIYSDRELSAINENEESFLSKNQKKTKPI